MYGEYLRRLLRPLGVYDLSLGSFSGAMTEACGLGMDQVETVLTTALREGIPATAEGDGLAKWEALFPFAPTASTAVQRRNALGGFLQVSGDSFTLAALSKCLEACGTQCRLEETDTPNHVRVSFPDVMGYPENYEEKQAVIESILPCHLAVDYALRWCTWGQTAQLGLTWGDLGESTWYEWSMTEVEE